jgi:hypothetical protein
MKGRMMKILNIEPSELASIGELITPLFFLLLGIALSVLGGNVFAGNEESSTIFILFIIFMLVWIGTALYMLAYRIINLIREKRMSLDDIEAEPYFQTIDEISDPTQKLRSLEMLKKDGLISRDEFKRKRKEIMQQKW